MYLIMKNNLKTCRSHVTLKQYFYLEYFYYLLILMQQILLRCINKLEKLNKYFKIIIHDALTYEC